MKKKLLLLITTLLVLNIGHSQTNVSGGIYSNTIWTKANSPYIVTGDIVVFPNVTITIEPGVVVKFDTNTYIEIRQGTIIAVGTPTDSITFTSNSKTPGPGSWDHIYLYNQLTSKFAYCNFMYATMGLDGYSSTAKDSIYVEHSVFRYNSNGIYDCQYISVDSCNFFYNSIGISAPEANFVTNCNFLHNYTSAVYSGSVTLTNCVIEYNNEGLDDLLKTTVDNCIIKYNYDGIFDAAGITTTYKNTIVDSNKNHGIELEGVGGDSIINCKIRYNRVGINDTVNGGGNIILQNIIDSNKYGIIMSAYDQTSCNSICNNSTYDLYYSGTNNIRVPNNYWCTADSAATHALIYDGYDNINYGLVFVTPIDTTQCSNIITSVNNILIPSTSFKLYPNPFTTSASLEFENCKHENCSLSVYDVMGQQLISINNITTNHIQIDRRDLADGVYFFQLKTDRQIIASGKFILE